MGSFLLYAWCLLVPSIPGIVRQAIGAEQSEYYLYAQSHYNGTSVCGHLTVKIATSFKVTVAQSQIISHN